MKDYAKARRARLKRRRSGSKKRKFKFPFFTVTLVLAGIVLISSIVVFAWFSRDLPSPDNIKRRDGFSTIIYDRDGDVLYDIYADENRKPISIEEVSEELKNATVAIEDKEFYEHKGYSTRGYMRAMYQIAVHRDLQGGSTLTQQLVKNVLLSSERSVPRKIKEFILAVQIEQKYSKDEILQMYLNEAPYGGTAWGVESAANLYFGKSASELDLVESAILAGMPQSPSLYSPYGSDPKAYVARTEHVLRRMREDDYISKEEERQALGQLELVRFAGKSNSFASPHFVTYVREQLVEQFGEELVEGGGLRVTTTIDSSMQDAAEEIVLEELEKVESLNVGNGAVVAMDPNTGEILALVGSKNYAASDDFDGMFNVAVQGLRQPGSALKPIVYATAFAKGYTPATMLMDVRTEYPSGDPDNPYSPENYDSKYRGPTQLRFALGNSINTIAVKTLALVSVEDMLQTAYDMGLSTLEPTKSNAARFGLSASLGGGEVTLLELTSAYGIFGSGGVKHEPVSILKVEDRNGKKLFEHKQRRGDRVMDEEVSFLISHILSDNNARIDVFGEKSWLVVPGKTVAVKTGTTDDKRDNWTVGYTKDIVVGVWVGNNDNSPMNKQLASGVTGAAPIWNKIMTEALKEREDGIIDIPNNVQAIEIDALGGGLPREGQAVRSEYFIKGTEPTSESSIYQKLKLSKNQSDKRANSDEIKTGEYDEKDFIVFEEDDPISTDGKNRWQDGINVWIDSQENDAYKFPRETSDHKPDSNDKDKDEDKKEDKKEDNPTSTPEPTPTKTSDTPTPEPTSSS